MSSRPFVGVAGTLLTLTLIAGCSVPASSPVPSPSSPVPSPSGPTSPAARSGEAVEVDPTVVEGISSSVEEDLKRGQYTYLSLPVIPGADTWLKQLRGDLAPQLDRFKELSPGTLTAPYPELSVNWQLVAASPGAIGVRLVTTELGADHTFQGKVETSWWDPETAAARPVKDLIRADAAQEFFTRLDRAAKTDPAIDYAAFYEQLSGDWESFNSVAFTTAGDLWVEFDRAQVSEMDQPVGIVVPADGLLSDFGEQARDASLFPRDPGLGRTASPTPSRTTSVAPPATAPVRSGKVDCAKLKCVALTFDDGPVSGTAALLDLFKAKRVRATFFMVGSNAAAHPALIRRMAAEGHVIGSHTWDHPQLTRLSADAIRRELVRTDDVIEKAGAPKVTLMRPPFGATNATVASVTAQLGLAQVLWSVDPLDWKDRNAAIVAQRVLASTRAGSIVLSHDIHPTSRQAYAAIIDGLRGRGFTFVTVPELIGHPLKPGKKYSRR